MSELKKLKMGYNFRGTEEVFENKLRQAVHERSTVNFRYVEIGIAEGSTIIAVAEVLRDMLPSHGWQAVGVDLVNGPFFNPRDFLARTLAFNTHIEFEGHCTRPPHVNHDIQNVNIRILLLKGDTKRATVAKDSVNFCLIDGCHGAPCVEADFLSIEQGIANGGIVAFHDAGEADQGQGFQHHCQMNIAVREALLNLGLFSGKNNDGYTHKEMTDCERSGWRYIGSVDGDKSPGDPCQNGNGFVFFQRILPTEE